MIRAKWICTIANSFMPSDQQIIDAVRAGDVSQFSHLVDRYEKRLIGLLWHLCGDRQWAEDLGQEAFFRSYRKLHLFAGQSQFYTWLARIAVNLLASARRKKTLESKAERQGFELVLENHGNLDNPESNIELNEMQHAVRRAIGMLDEERRAILLLRDFEDMDYETIASVLNIPIGTVRSRLHRARLELRHVIESIAPQFGSMEIQ